LKSAKPLPDADDVMSLDRAESLWVMPDLVGPVCERERWSPLSPQFAVETLFWLIHRDEKGH
jgi:hypothetical protein